MVKKAAAIIPLLALALAPAAFAESFSPLSYFSNTQPAVITADSSNDLFISYATNGTNCNNYTGSPTYDANVVDVNCADSFGDGDFHILFFPNVGTEPFSDSNIQNCLDNTLSYSACVALLGSSTYSDLTIYFLNPATAAKVSIPPTMAGKIKDGVSGQLSDLGTLKLIAFAAGVPLLFVVIGYVISLPPVYRKKER